MKEGKAIARILMEGTLDYDTFFASLLAGPS